MVTADDQYLETKVMTATPWQLHLMVLDAAIRQATVAQAALESNDFERAHFALNSSRDCVNELISGLNPEQLPELIERLKALFAFAYRNLAEADLHHDAVRVGDALRILKLHRETWLALGEKLRQESAETSDGAEQTSWQT